MGAQDFRSALADVRAVETCFHGRHINPQIMAGLNSPDGWHLADYEARDGYKALRKIIDEKLMYFAYWDDAPIGFFLMVPDLNGVIGPLGGRFGLVQKLRFLWRLKVSRKARRIFAIIFGVVPDFQGKGIESGMIRTFEEEVA